MVRHARIACDEAGHWMSGLARAEQVVRREEVKRAASEDRTLSLTCRASEKKRGLFLAPKKALGVLFICFINVNGRWRAQSHPSGHTSPNEPPAGLRVPGGANFCKGLRSEGEI